MRRILSVTVAYSVNLFTMALVKCNSSPVRSHILIPIFCKTPLVKCNGSPVRSQTLIPIFWKMPSNQGFQKENGIGRTKRVKENHHTNHNFQEHVMVQVYSIAKGMQVETCRFWEQHEQYPGFVSKIILLPVERDCRLFGVNLIDSSRREQEKTSWESSRNSRN